MCRILAVALIVFSGSASAASFFIPTDGAIPGQNYVKFPSSLVTTNTDGSLSLRFPKDVGGWVSNADGNTAWAESNLADFNAGLTSPVEATITGNVEVDALSMGEAGAEWCFAAPEVCLAGIGVAAIVGQFVNPAVFFDPTKDMWMKRTTGTQTTGLCHTGYGDDTTGGNLTDCVSLAVSDFEAHQHLTIDSTTVSSTGGGPCVPASTTCVVNGHVPQIGGIGAIATFAQTTIQTATESPASKADWRDAYFDQASRNTASGSQMGAALTNASQPITVPSNDVATLSANPASQSVDLGSSTTTNPDGTTSTKQNLQNVNMNCSGNTVATAVCSPQVSNTVINNTPSGTTTTTTTQTPQQQQTQQCGLSGQAPCSVKEAGTFVAPTIGDAMTFGDATQAFMSRVAAAPLLAGVSSIHLAGSGSCPTYSLSIWRLGTYTFDAQCTVAEAVRAPLGAIMLMVFGLLAVRHFLSA